MATTTHAVVFTGAPPARAVEVHTRPVADPAPDEVRVRVRAAALNRADLLQRAGRYPAPPGIPEDQPGLEFAGEVEAVGSAVREWREGDRVCGLVGGAAQAERLVTRGDLLAPAPRGLTWPEAAAVPEAFVTAADALWLQAELAPAETVLIHAVGSGVGLAAVQVARAIGAVPYGTTRTAEKLAPARALGLADGLAVEGDLAAIGRAAREWTGGRGVDVVLDLVGGPYAAAALDALAPRGRLVLVGTVAGASAELPLGLALRKRLTIRGTVLRARPLDEKIAVTRLLADRIVPLVERGTFAPSIDTTLPLERAAEAYERLASNETVGKVVLEMGAED